MVTGRIAYIDYFDKIHTSIKFHKDMEPKVLGNEIIKFFENAIYNCSNFEMCIKNFNDTYFQYTEKLTNAVSGDWYNTRYDYENKWNCDYVYIKNLSLATKYFVTPDGFVALPPKEILTLHLGKVIEEDKLPHINVGDIVTVADIEWIVLKKTNDTVFCLTKNFINLKKNNDSVFCLTDYFNKNTIGFAIETTNYAESEIHTYLQSFAKKLKDKIGENALISREIDLTTDADKTDYGKIIDDIGLLTENEYKKFESVIKNYPVEDWWWLATAHPKLQDAVLCIRKDGTLTYDVNYSHLGVRPACIFSAEIFK